MNIQIKSASEFLNKLTASSLTTKQINRSVAYLRGKGVAFYDNWSKDHCLVVADMPKNKIIVLDALRASLNN